MIFTRLKLNNFKSHEHTVITFDKGISVIVGDKFHVHRTGIHFQ